jgi:hypothetical protein
MNYEITDIICIYKEITDLATSYYDIANEIYLLLKFDKKNTSWSTIILNYINHVDTVDIKYQQIDSIIKNTMAINVLCRPIIIDKLTFLQEHSSLFNNETVNFALYYIKDTIDLTNVIDIKKYIIKLLTVNILFLGLCNYLFDIIRSDIINAKLDIENFKTKINREFIIMRNEKKKINCPINDDKKYLLHKNSLFKKLFNLKQQMFDHKIAELEEKRIKLFLEVKKNSFHLQSIKQDVKQINKITNKSSKLILKINKIQ